MSTENNQEEQEFNAEEAFKKLQETELFKTYTENSKKEYWRENIGKELKQVYTPFDTSIEKHLGVKKPDDLKSSEWLDKNLADLVAARKELESIKAKKEQSSEEIDIYKQQLKDKELLLAEKDKKVEELIIQGKKKEIGSSIDRWLLDKPFREAYTESDLNILVPNKKSLIVDNTKTLEDGTKVVMNPETNEYYKDPITKSPLTPVQVAELLFKPMFKTSKKGGAATSDTTTASAEGNVIAIDMSKITTKSDFFVEFQKQIAPKGLASHEEKYLEIQRATMKHFGIDKLPMS